MKKQPERTTATRKNIIDAFIALSQRKPMDKITISALAAKAGYNRSTFYQYFDDIFDLIADLEDDMLAYIKETILPQIGKEKTEEIFISSFIKINAEKKDTLQVLLKNGSFSGKLKEALIPAFAAQMNFSPDDQSSVYLVDFYLSGIISILSRWITAEPPISPENYARLMRQIVEGMKKSGLFPVI